MLLSPFILSMLVCKEQRKLIQTSNPPPSKLQLSSRPVGRSENLRGHAIIRGLLKNRVFTKLWMGGISSSTPPVQTALSYMFYLFSSLWMIQGLLKKKDFYQTLPPLHPQFRRPWATCSWPGKLNLPAPPPLFVCIFSRATIILSTRKVTICSRMNTIIHP